MNYDNGNYMDSDDDDSDEGYNTADENVSRNDVNRNARSRTRTDRLRQLPPRDRSRGYPNHRTQSRRRRNQRRRRRNQAERSESWYFPDERAEENTQLDAESQERLITDNRNWIEELENDQARRITVSPLAQGNQHTIAWRDNSRTVTLTRNRSDRQPVRNAASSENREEQNTENDLIRARQDNPLPNGSLQAANFNLAQHLQERGRAIQQLTQAASQIQVAAAAAAASYAQLVSQQSRDVHNGQQGGVQSLNTWDNRIQHAESWLNSSLSETHHGNTSDRRQPAGRHQRPLAPQPDRSNQAQNDAALANAASDTGAVAVPGTSRNGSDHGLGSDGISAPNSSNSSQETLGQLYQPVSDESDRNLFSRFDAAFRQQEARNAWRQRRRQRRERQEWREMEDRNRERRRPRPLRTERSRAQDIDQNAPANAPPPLLHHTFPPPPPPNPPQPQEVPANIPPAPPLPPLDWQQPARQNNEWLDAPNHMAITPGVLQGGTIERETAQGYESSSADEADVEDSTDHSEMTEYVLRSYQDPGEGNSRLGEFIRRVTARGRVIVSRVRTRITKQYFRRGDFQIALADFRSLHPEHARQVSGVGFTGTINNMYRLTVKQNSSFGKPTFEIRPMNKKVRRKKVHVCYKIRYFGHRRAPERRGRSRILNPMRG